MSDFTCEPVNGTIIRVTDTKLDGKQKEAWYIIWREDHDGPADVQDYRWHSSFHGHDEIYTWDEIKPDTHKGDKFLILYVPPET